MSKPGHRHSPETIEKIRLWHLGRPRSHETKAKISTSSKGLRAGKKHPMYGVHRYGESAANWRGGRKKDSGGYIYIYSPTHPHQDAKRYVFEHRLVMEKHLGRTLLPTEVVHHINGIVNDNRIENLMLFSSNVEHLKFHKEKP